MSQSKMPGPERASDFSAMQLSPSQSMMFSFRDSSSVAPCSDCAGRVFCSKYYETAIRMPLAIASQAE
jgi:hypothetical protein